MHPDAIWIDIAPAYLPDIYKPGSRLQFAESIQAELLDEK
jgi:hypothetical protein